MVTLARAVRVGLVLFVLGLIFLAADVLPFFFGDRNRPLWLSLGCLLAPIGFAVAVWAGVRAGHADQREAQRAVQDATAPAGQTVAR